MELIEEKKKRRPFTCPKCGRIVKVLNSRHWGGLDGEHWEIAYKCSKCGHGIEGD